jgi:hypothetical protein
MLTLFPFAENMAGSAATAYAQRQLFVSDIEKQLRCVSLKRLYLTKRVCFTMVSGMSRMHTVVSDCVLRAWAQYFQATFEGARNARGVERFLWAVWLNLFCIRLSLRIDLRL